MHSKTQTSSSELHSCGVIHWSHKTRRDRYIVFLYKTSDFSGNLLDATDEGRVFWIDPEELKNRRLSSNFANYLPMFMSEKHSEAYGLWCEDEPDVLIYK